MGNWSRFFLYKSDPEETAYYEVRDLVSRWQQQHGEGGVYGGGALSAKSQALRYYKMALRYGDKEAAQKYLKEYMLLGGTKQGMATSMKAMDPLSGLKTTEKPKFLKSLSKADREQLVLAQRFWREMAIGE